MVCSACLDDDVSLAFQCRTRKCPYGLCEPCVKLAWEDASGANCRECPNCKAPTARSMVESVCGIGAVREVERDLRIKVEHEVQKENMKKEKGRAQMSSYEERAHKFYLELADSLNMKCPKCHLVFDDYTGCNALHCRNTACGAAFCAICLEDCGNDAHPHARQHGNLFDKELFLQAKLEREQATINLFLIDHADEPFEVKELVRIKCEQMIRPPETERKHLTSRFLTQAKADLQEAVRKDRLSVLSDTKPTFRGLTLEDISPRNAIPEEFELRLFAQSGFKCSIRLRQLLNGEWNDVPLPDEGENRNREESERPVVDALVNVRQSLQSCSIAFAGSRCLYQTSFARNSKDERTSGAEVTIKFSTVNGATGEVRGDGLSLHDIGCSGTTILGFNQNQRMLMFERHVEQSTPEELLFEPLLHYVGGKQSVRLLDKLSVPAPETFEELNSQQQLVAHPLSVKTAMECAGPPGTGKTKVITELMRSILYCTEYDVIIMSERNGAVDAIAEKLARDCINDVRKKSQTVKDFALWKQVIAFGSSGMGSSSRLFTVEEKLKIHPELVEYRRLIEEKRQAIAVHKKAMLRNLAGGIEALGASLPPGSDAEARSALIAGGNEYGLSRPPEIITTVSKTVEAIKTLLSKATIQESEVEQAIVDHSSVLGRLIRIADKSEKAKYKDPFADTPWKQRSLHIIRGLKSILICLDTVLRSELYSMEKAEESSFALKQLEEDHKRSVTRISQELLKDARVIMGTIGSSHKFPVASDEESEDFEGAFGRLNIKEGASSKVGKETIVVFDEAGCIPAYELLGISRLKRSVKSLVCVGDKHQLPPYAPSAFSRTRQSVRGLPVATSQAIETKVASLLDVSALEENGDTGSKIRLKTQYRVPRDIANVLNQRIYNNSYRTPVNCAVPSHGFHFVHVSYCHGSKKYENDNEVRKCLDILKAHASPGQSIMILTPYKKQQRKLQYELKQSGFDDDRAPVLTIDQCQGQEADLVVLSLVQRPTRFLNKNRFNVALSRVRQNLFLLCDKKDFSDAAKNFSWECALLAKDLLHLAAASSSLSRLDGDDDSDGGDDWYDGF